MGAPPKKRTPESVGLQGKDDFESYLSTEYKSYVSNNGTDDYYTWLKNNEQQLRSNWEGTFKPKDPQAIADAGKVAAKEPPPGPDMTDKLILETRKRQLTGMMGRGRKSTFLGGAKAGAPYGSTLLGGE